MNKKILILVLFMISSMYLVIAENVVPIESEIKVDFNGERDFSIILPNGGERHYYWESNQTHSDSVFNYTFYYEYDDDEVCGDSSRVGEYRNISSTMVEMLGVCKDMVININDTDGCENELVLVKAEMYGYQNERDTYKEKWEEKKNESLECKSDYETVKSERDQYYSTMTTLQNRENEYNECKDDLEQSDNSKNLNLLIGFLVGGGAVFMFYKRKNMKMGPSEQMESNLVTDYYQRPHQQANLDFPPQFDDGPKM